MLGSDVVDDNGEIIGFIGGCYFPEVYIATLCDKWGMSFEDASKKMAKWDEEYPGWREELVPIVVFKNAVKNMTRKEVAELFGMPVENVTDKLYDKSTTTQRMMVMPLKAVKIKTRAQQ